MNQAQVEFDLLISRCMCSRKALRITPEEAKEMNERFETDKTPEYKIEPIEPSCTPEKCFPELYALVKKQVKGKPKK